MCLVEPRLGGPPLQRRAKHVVAHVDADGARTRGDQRELADAIWMRRGVQQGEITTRRVGEEIEPIDPKMLAQCVDVGDDLVDAPRRQFEHDQFLFRAEAAQVAEVSRRAQRAAGHDHQRVAVADDPACQLGSVVRSERGHRYRLVS